MSTPDPQGAINDTIASVRQAGQTLRRLREERGLTQRDVERLSGGKLFAQQVSRLETGALSKPPMEDLIVLGRIYGLSPSDIARLYGYGQHDTGISLSIPSPEAEGISETRQRSMRATAEQLRRLRRERELERGTTEEDLARRILQIENLATLLPDVLRVKLNYWLDLIIALLSDELRAADAPDLPDAPDSSK